MSAKQKYRMEQDWCNDYVGIPFIEHGRGPNGVDCYGLVRLVLMECCDIVIPSFVEEYTSVDQRDLLSVKILQEASDTEIWVPVLKGQEKPFDVMVVRMLNTPSHVGMVVRKGLLLHCCEGQNSTTVDYRRGEWIQPGKIVGIYRHKNLCR